MIRSSNRKKLMSDIFSVGQYKPEKNDEVKGPLLVLGYFGIFLLVIGFLVLLPLVMLIFYPDESHEFKAFLIPGSIALVLGGLLSLIIFRRKQGKLTAIQDLILVIGVWFLVILFSCFPYLFYGYSFTQAFFDSTAGYTSTGLSTINWAEEIVYLEDGTTDVVSHMLFFHRAVSELVGGIGLVLVVSSAISERSGLNLYLLEGHNDKLLPNLVKSARLIFSLYMCYILVGSCLYMAVGVKPFDAVTHSMCAVATGGFSTKVNNLNTLVNEVSLNGTWRGVCVEIISEILMLLGGTNFVIHYSLLRGKFKVLRHFEYIVMLIIILLIYPFMVVGMTKYYNGNVGLGFRYGTFELISSISTCGFQAVDSYQGHVITSGGFTTISSSMSANELMSGYNSGSIIQFPSYLLILLGILMSIGMQNGSTTGAIKMNRVGLLFMDIYWRIKGSIGVPELKKVHTTYKFGQKTKIEQSEVTEAETFIGIYVLFLLLGTTLLSCIVNWLDIRGEHITPFTWEDMFLQFSSCLSTAGLNCGLTNNSTIPAILWIEIVGMLLGRLEIFVYFTLAGKTIKSIKNKKYLYKTQK